MMHDVAEFARDWYLVKPNILDGARRAALCDYALFKEQAALLQHGDEQVADAAFAYSDPEIDRLLEDLRPSIEQSTGFALWPTFSYMRVYRPGHILKAHRDRPACEISITLNLGMDVDAPWPIWISGPNGIAAVALEPGSGLIYRGCDCYHWREPFDGRFQVQAFLHYVEQAGSRAEWKFDKRPHLSIPA